MRIHDYHERAFAVRTVLASSLVGVVEEVEEEAKERGQDYEVGGNNVIGLGGPVGGAEDGPWQPRSNTPQELNHLRKGTD